MVILTMYLEMLGQVLDPIGEQRHLHFRRPGVGLVPPIGLHDLARALLEHCHPALSVSVFSRFLW
jgi:hypothetical protein